MTDTRTNSLQNPVTVADLHAGLHNTLRGFFHGKVDESTVIDRVQFLAMLAYPTTDAHQVQDLMDDVREDYQDSDDATLADFIQDLNSIEQNTASDDDDPTNPASDHQANRAAAAAVQEAREALRAESNRLIVEQRAIDATTERTPARCSCGANLHHTLQQDVTITATVYPTRDLATGFVRTSHASTDLVDVMQQLNAHEPTAWYCFDCNRTYTNAEVIKALEAPAPEEN